MPLKLILMRHAKSSWDDPLQTDYDRPLNERGRASAVAIGKWLRKFGHEPDMSLSSSSRRTQETYDLLGFDADVHFTKTLYHAGAYKMLSELQGATGRSVLLLGHNPGIAELAERLASRLPAHSRFLDYPTCATTVFEFHCDNWQNVDFGMGQIKAFTVPRDLS